MSDHPPTLFKYEPFSLRAVQNLKQQAIYFGSPSGFNDPFDCAHRSEIEYKIDFESFIYTSLAEAKKSGLK